MAEDAVRRWLVLAVFIGIAVVALWRPRPTSETDEREKEAIHAADTVYLREVDTLRLVRTTTDSFLQADTVFTREEVKVIVEKERSSCDQADSACGDRVATRDRRIKTLEARQKGTLFLYSEAGVQAQIPTFTDLRFEAEAGVAVRLDRETYLQGSATTGGDLRISVRRQLRLF